MQRTSLGAGLAALAVLASAAPAQAQTAEPERTTYFMTCGGPTKVQNVNGAAGMVPSWSTTAPAQSFTAGAGCGFLDPPLTAATAPNEFDGYFGGTHGGAIDKAEIEAHSLVLSRARAGATNSIRLRIFVDGEEVFNNGIEAKTPIASSTGASESFKFEVSGLKIKAGAKDRPIFVVLGAAGQSAQAWVGGATEVPTKVTFTAPPPPLPPAAG